MALKYALQRTPCFIKPYKNIKKFTGRIINSEYDIIDLSISLNTHVWCSSIVEFVSEYRCFVLNKKYIGCVHYDGDEKVKIDEDIVKKFVEEFTDSPISYVVDFGVLKDGQTALIEVNDGFSFGHYDFNIKTILDILITRWCEITK